MGSSLETAGATAVVAGAFLLMLRAALAERAQDRAEKTERDKQLFSVVDRTATALERSNVVIEDNSKVIEAAVRATKVSNSQAKRNAR